MRSTHPLKGRRLFSVAHLTIAHTLFRGILSFVILLLVVFGASLVYAYIRYSSDKNSYERLVLLPNETGIEQSPVVVVSVDFVAKRVIWLKLPKDLLLPLASGRGEGRIGSLASKEDDSWKQRHTLIKDTFQKALGWKINTVLYSNSDSLVEGSEELHNLVRTNLFEAAVNQRLNWWKIWMIDQALSSGSFKKQLLPYTLFINQIIDVDGQSVEQWSTERWDAYLKTEGLITRLESGKGVSVTVINTTLVPGLGAQVARMVTNNGFDVVGVRSGESVDGLTDTILWRESQLELTYGPFLGDLFPEMMTKVIGDEFFERSEVVIYTGEKSQSRW